MRCLLLVLTIFIFIDAKALEVESNNSVIGSWNSAFFPISPGKNLRLRIEVVRSNLSYLQVTVGDEKREGFYLENSSRALKLVFGDCLRDPRNKEIIIAVVKHDDFKEVLDDVYIAWRYDAELESLVSISPRGVTCINESYGV